MDYSGHFRSGTTDQYTGFTRPAGYSSFAMEYSRDGGTWTAVGSPTIVEETHVIGSDPDLSTYRVLLNTSGMMTLTSGNITEVVRFRISTAGMQSVFGFVVLYVDDQSHLLGHLLEEGGSAPTNPIGYA